MIYNIINTLSQSVRGLWQFWSLQGLVLMTSTAIQGSNLLEGFANSFSPKPVINVFDSNTDSNNSSATPVTPVLSKSATHCPNLSVTFSEIFIYAMPSSSEALEFDNLVKQIWVVKDGTSLVDRDDAKVAQAFILMSNIIDLNWSKFSVKVKVLLLDKLQPFNKSIWQFIIENIFKFPNALKDKSEKNKKYISEYNSLDSSSQQKLAQKSLDNSRLLIKSVSKILTDTSKVFKEDGYLLKENQENIGKFNSSVKTIIAGRYIMKKYASTLEELAK